MKLHEIETCLRFALSAMSDGDLFDAIGRELGKADDEMVALRDKLEAYLNEKK